MAEAGESLLLFFHLLILKKNVLSEFGVWGKRCDWHPMGVPALKEMMLKWGLSLKNHLLSARSFISASPVQGLGSRIIIITIMMGRVISSVCLRGYQAARVVPLWGKGYFVNFHLFMRRGQSHFLSLVGNSIQLNKHLLIY